MAKFNQFVSDLSTTGKGVACTYDDNTEREVFVEEFSRLWPQWNICLNPKKHPCDLSAYNECGDLMAFIEHPIAVAPKSSCLVPTGLSVAFEEGYEIQIRPRSGLAAKNKISVLNTPGTIDSDYRGEIKIILFNHGNQDFIINNKDRVAQMILAPVHKMNFEEVDNLPTSIREKGGFGSTGK